MKAVQGIIVPTLNCGRVELTSRKKNRSKVPGPKFISIEVFILRNDGSYSSVHSFS